MVAVAERVEKTENLDLVELLILSQSLGAFSVGTVDAEGNIDWNDE